MKIFKYLSFLGVNTSILLLFFFLSISKTHGAVGDVYFCEMDQFAETKKGKIQNYVLEKFKFKRSKNKIVFGNEENTFKGYSMEVLFSTGEFFSGGNEYVRFHYDEGYFHFARADMDGAQMMSAKCSIF